MKGSEEVEKLGRNECILHRWPRSPVMSGCSSPSQKKNPSNHKDTYVNNIPLNRKNTQKYLGLYLDAKLNFS